MTQNIKGAWRTRKQALKHILTELLAGRLGAQAGQKNRPWDLACAYESTTNGVVRHCGVGCLFNDAQLRSIKARKMNSIDVSSLADTIGEDNLTTVTGLQISELETIQALHDDFADDIRDRPAQTRLHGYLTRELKKA